MLLGNGTLVKRVLTLSVAGGLALGAGSAGAATSIGPSPALNGNPSATQAVLFAAPVTLLTTAGPSGQVLTAPSSGVITSWRLYTGEVKGSAATAQLRVLKNVGGDEFEAVRSGPAQPVDEVSAATANKSFMHEFKVSVPISAGETIGVGLASVFTPSPSFVLPALPVVEGQGWKYGCIGCLSPNPEDGHTGTATVTESQWVAQTAQIEADENHDGLGDETQEPAGACLSNCGGSNPPGPSNVKKKCKKGKRLKHGKCVKKKHHRKHHHKRR